MFRRIVFTAALAGLVAGLLMTAVQLVAALPLIEVAERYEALAEGGHEAHGHGHDHDHAGSTTGGFRLLLTGAANILTATGFGLLLAAAFALRDGIDWRRGLLWGVAGFAVFHLAPGLGLPPEPPGVPSAPLADRQLWWLLAVVASGAGLALIVFAGRLWAKAAGVLLLVVPHLVGAPQPPMHEALMPEEIQQRFMIAAFLSNAAAWLALGAIGGFLYGRLGARDRVPLAQS